MITKLLHRFIKLSQRNGLLLLFLFCTVLTCSLPKSTGLSLGIPVHWLIRKNSKTICILLL